MDNITPLPRHCEERNDAAIHACARPCATMDRHGLRPRDDEGERRPRDDGNKNRPHDDDFLSPSLRVTRMLQITQLQG